MSDALWIALIVAVPTLFSAPFMVWLQNRNAAAKELRDYARQDAVAAKAAEVAQLLLDRQEEVSNATREAARLLKENQKTVAETAAATQTQLKKLTGMVDGNFTRLMEAELDAISHGLVLSRQVVSLTFNSGHEPPPESLAAIEATQTKIADLTRTIAERHHTEAAMKFAENANHHGGPVPVTDERAAVAAERSATATERIATATEEKSNPAMKP